MQAHHPTAVSQTNTTSSKLIDSADHQSKFLNKGSTFSVMDSSILPSSCISSSPLSSSLVGDYIGVESCLDLKTNYNEEVFTQERNSHRSYVQRRNERWSSSKNNEFPPPITLLARTENLPCRMPWVLKRYYTSDGRLILREEKVRHHEYLRAQRSNGRLVLHLVPLDDDVFCNHASDGREETESYEFDKQVCDPDEESDDEVDIEEITVTNENCVADDDVESEEFTVTDENNSVDDDDDGSDDLTFTDEDEFVHDDQKIHPLDIENGGIGGNGKGSAVSGKCLKFVDTAVTIPTCLFRVSLSALRPVHS